MASSDNSRHAVAETLSGWDGSPVIAGPLGAQRVIDHLTATTIHDARRISLEAGEFNGVTPGRSAWVDVGMVSGPRNDRYAAVYVYGEVIGEWRKDKRGWRFQRN